MFVHQPDFKIIVNLTQARGDFVQELLVGRYVPLRRFITFRLVKSSLVDLEKAQLEAGALAKNAFVRFESDIDVPNNAVKVKLDSSNPKSKKIESQLLSQGVKVVLDTDFIQPLAGSITGGLSLTECTSGFGVIRPGDNVRGVTTAAHCGNTSQFYQGVQLPWVDGKYEGSWDVQWHTTPSFTPTNLVRFNYLDQPYEMRITSLKARGSQAIGEYTCKQGRVTNYACGYIRSKSVWPAAIPNSNPTFMSVSSSTMSGIGGDSGGSVFHSNAAYGTIHGLDPEPDPVTGDPVLVYMPADEIARALGVYILVTP